MPLPRTIKDGLRNFALEPAQRDQLRKLRASLGEERTARALRMGKETVNLLLYDGGVTAATRDRVADYLRSMTMSEQASAGMTEEEMIAAIEAETPLKRTSSTAPRIRSLPPSPRPLRASSKSI